MKFFVVLSVLSVFTAGAYASVGAGLAAADVAANGVCGGAETVISGLKELSAKISPVLEGVGEYSLDFVLFCFWVRICILFPFNREC